VRKTKTEKRKAGSMVEWRMVDPSFCEQGDKWSIEEESREGEVVGWWWRRTKSALIKLEQARDLGSRQQLLLTLSCESMYYNYRV